MSVKGFCLAFNDDLILRIPGDARCYCSGTLLASFAVAYCDQQWLTPCHRT
jgi:hypothetical protein